MLKRFMNWLLHKWQGLFGALGGKRRTSLRFLSDRTAKPNNPDPSDMGIPVAARTPFTPSTESLLKPSAEPVVPAANRPAVLPKIIKSDTHQRIDITPAALTDSVKPVFPTEVSALMGSPLQPGEGLGADLPFRALKKIPDSQLPAIHDLLPATEADELSEQAQPNKPVENLSDQVVLFSFDIVESDPIDPIDPIEHSSEDSDRLASDDVMPDAPLDATNSLSALLPEDRASINAEISETAEIAENVESEPTEITEEGLEHNDAYSQTEERSTTQDDSLAPLPSTSSAEIQQSVEAFPEPTLLTTTEILPYPWSLPVSGLDPQVLDPQVLDPQVADQESASSAKASSTAGSDALSSQPSQSLAPPGPSVEETDEVWAEKNGIVKLLFTLKEGNFHGYIAPDDGSQDILFHQKYINADIFSELYRGIQVTVSVKYVEGKAYATHVELL